MNETIVTGPGGAAPVQAIGLPGDAAAGLWANLTELVHLGGPVVALLLLMSVFALAVILVKAWQYVRLRRVPHGKIAKAVALWVGDDRDGALAAMSRYDTPVARVVRLAMRASASQRSEAHVREEVEAAALGEVASLRSYLRALQAVAEVAPLLGLYGTVIGMIEAFSALEASGVRVNPADLAGGIWVALLTTAVGLAVAIPVSLVLYAFESRVDRERRAMEAFSTAVLTNPPAPNAAPKAPRVGQAAPLSVAGAAHAH